MDKVQKIVDALESEMNIYKAAAIQCGNWAKEKMAKGDKESSLEYSREESKYLTKHEAMRSAYCIALIIQREEN